MKTRSERVNCITLFLKIGHIEINFFRIHLYVMLMSYIKSFDIIYGPCNRQFCHISYMVPLRQVGIIIGYEPELGQITYDP